MQWTRLIKLGWDKWCSVEMDYVIITPGSASENQIAWQELVRVLLRLPLLTQTNFTVITARIDFLSFVHMVGGNESRWLGERRPDGVVDGDKWKRGCRQHIGSCSTLQIIYSRVTEIKVWVCSVSKGCSLQQDYVQLSCAFTAYWSDKT